MEEKFLFFKVFQDRESIDGCDYFVCRLEEIEEISEDWYVSDEDLPVVFEPVYMTEEEYNSLPEFEGY